MKENHFPPALAALSHWVCWRLEPDQKSGRDAKVPYCPLTGKRASPSNPATWATLDEALHYCDKYHYSGIGFMFTLESGIVGIDIDHCLENGKPNEIATDILSHLPQTYIEISPSGTGLHIFLRGALPPGGNRNSKNGVEMYSNARYFTMTGNRYQGAVDIIAEDNSALEYIHAKYVAQLKKTKAKSTFQPGLFLSDNDVIKLAQQSKDSAAFDALWRGEWQEKYKSQSEADFALCRKLAFWTARNEAQIDRLFRQSGLYREKWDARHSAGGATYGETTIKNACGATDQVYSPPKKQGSGEIFESGGQYFRNKNERVYAITNFVIRPIEMIRAEEEVQLKCTFIGNQGRKETVSMIAEDFSCLKNFKKVLKKKGIDYCFFGTETDLELLCDHLRTLEWRKKTGVMAIGIYPRNRSLAFVDTNGAVGVGGKAVNDIVQLKKYRGITSHILDAPMLTKDQLLQLGQHILSHNLPTRTVPVLAWCAGCFVKPHLRHADIKFPHLFLIGEPGSGKTSSLEFIIAPIFGLKYVLASSQVSAFSIMKEASTSNIIPQLLDEFKPSKLKIDKTNGLYNHFRDAYDMHQGMRGNADQTITTYDLLAPIVVAGEESADESAIRDRSIEILFSQKETRIPEYRTSHDWIKENDDILRSFGRSLLDMALRTKPSETARWHDEGRDYFDKNLTERVYKNLCTMFTGLSLIGQLCQHLGTTFDTVFPLDHAACAANLEAAVREYLLDDSSYNKGAVEQGLEIMARMKLKKGEDYWFENHGEHLCIWLSGVYDKFTRYKKDYAVAGETLRYSQFCKQLGLTDYLIRKSHQVRFADDEHRIWTLNFVKLSRICDVSGFDISAQKKAD